MTDAAYKVRRGELETYFDRTAADKWVALTSNGPISAIRETVRQGREEMRATLLSWLPQDLTGARILDAGCGTGMLARDVAARGADVLAVDLSSALIKVAEERTLDELYGHRIEFRAGDMTDTSLGEFDYVVAMDSFIHYPIGNVIDLLAGFAGRTRRGIMFTFAPKTPLLAAMHVAGKVFPRDNRSPAIVPIAEHKIAAAIEAGPDLQRFGIVRTQRVTSAFYKSQAMELKVR